MKAGDLVLLGDEAIYPGCIASIVGETYITDVGNKFVLSMPTLGTQYEFEEHMQVVTDSKLLKDEWTILTAKQSIARKRISKFKEMICRSLDKGDMIGAQRLCTLIIDLEREYNE